MSFIKKELTVLPTQKVAQEISHAPQHPMLKYTGPTAPAVRDHLEEYDEVRPFEESEGLKGWVKRKKKAFKAGIDSISGSMAKAREAGKKAESIEATRQLKKKAAKIEKNFV